MFISSYCYNYLIEFLNIGKLNNYATDGISNPQSLGYGTLAQSDAQRKLPKTSLKKKEMPIIRVCSFNYKELRCYWKNGLNSV